MFCFSFKSYSSCNCATKLSIISFIDLIFFGIIYTLTIYNNFCYKNIMGNVISKELTQECAYENINYKNDEKDKININTSKFFIRRNSSKSLLIDALGYI